MCLLKIDGIDPGKLEKKKEKGPASATACVEYILGLSSVDLAVKCLVLNGSDTVGRAYCRMKSEVEVRGSERDILRFGIGLCSTLMKGMKGWNLLRARQAASWAVCR